MNRSESPTGWSETEVIRALEVAGIDFIVDGTSRRAAHTEDLRIPVIVVVERAPDGGSSLQLGALTVDLQAGTLDRGGDVERLRPREWQLLNALAHRRGATVPTTELLERVWGRQDRRAALHTTLRRLRLKVESDPDHPLWLVTVRGVGVRLESEARGPGGPQARGRPSGLRS